MNNLPCEILEKIFNHFDLVERMDYRIVCKTWRYLLDRLYSNRNLLLTENDLFKNINIRKCKRWFINDYERELKLKENDQLVYTFYFLDRLNCKSCEIILSKLNCLIVYIAFNYEIDNKIIVKFFKFLNKFKTINKLELLSDSNLDNYDKNLTINQPELKIFCFKGFKFDSLTFETPNLDKLYLDIKSDNELKLIFNYPSTIKYLRLNDYNESIDKLFNLEYLDLKNLQDLKDNFLLNFKQLIFMNIDDTIDQFINLIEQKLDNNLINLRTYFRSILIKDLDEYKKLISTNKTVMEVYFSPEFEKTIKLPLVQSLNYNYLEQNQINITKSILDRFINLEYIFINSQITNENNLAQLIKNSNNLLDLTFKRCLISEQFFYQLSELNQFITALRLNTLFTVNEDNFNLEFIFNFKYLSCLLIEKEISLDFIRSLFMNLNYLSTLIFNFKGHSNYKIISIFPEDIFDQYLIKHQLYTNDDDKIDFKCLDDLINYLNDLE